MDLTDIYVQHYRYSIVCSRIHILLKSTGNIFQDRSYDNSQKVLEKFMKIKVTISIFCKFYKIRNL